MTNVIGSNELREDEMTLEQLIQRNRRALADAMTPEMYRALVHSLFANARKGNVAAADMLVYRVLRCPQLLGPDATTRQRQKKILKLLAANPNARAYWDALEAIFNKLHPNQNTPESKDMTHERQPAVNNG
jgi:hypothetical protein